MKDKKRDLTVPWQLPYCHYPQVGNPYYNGLQPLPTYLPTTDFSRAKPYRSQHYTLHNSKHLSAHHIIAMAKQSAAAFAQYEPQTRYLQLPLPPTGLLNSCYTDVFGTEQWGSWTTEQLLYWFIRTSLLAPAGGQFAHTNNTLNADIIAHSFALLDKQGNVMGSAFNESLNAATIESTRLDHPFLTAIATFMDPILTLLTEQSNAAITALRQHYPHFNNAYHEGKVGHHFMISKAPMLPKEHTFELVATTAEHFKENGYTYIIVEATNQWTGAACEMLNGVRVHFSPFHLKPRVTKSEQPLEGRVTSPSGFISDKNSGSMLYILKLC